MTKRTVIRVIAVFLVPFYPLIMLSLKIGHMIDWWYWRIVGLIEESLND
jgi:hypothetical protein